MSSCRNPLQRNPNPSQSERSWQQVSIDGNRLPVGPRAIDFQKSWGLACERISQNHHGRCPTCRADGRWQSSCHEDDRHGNHLKPKVHFLVSPSLSRRMSCSRTISASLLIRMPSSMQRLFQSQVRGYLQHSKTHFSSSATFSSSGLLRFTSNSKESNLAIRAMQIDGMQGAKNPRNQGLIRAKLLEMIG